MMSFLVVPKQASPDARADVSSTVLPHTVPTVNPAAQLGRGSIFSMRASEIRARFDANREKLLLLASRVRFR
jgi:hypothetical protein